MITDGAMAIIRHMGNHGAQLHGDLSRDVPLFFLPTDSKRRMSDPIEPPAARYCRELKDLGLIEPIGGSSGCRQTFLLSPLGSNCFCQSGTRA